MKSINLMKNVGRFTPPPKSSSPTYPQIVCAIYPQIICTIYPPQFQQVWLTLKLSVRLTIKSSLAIYPQIVFGDLPPPKLPSLTYPQIVFGDLLPFKCEVQFIHVVIIHCHFLRLL